MATLLSLLLGIAALFACMLSLPRSTGIAFPLLLLGAVVYIVGNRWQRERTAERRHREVLATMRGEYEDEE
jgi:hypothetical protein